MPLCSCSLPALGCLSGEEGPACLPELGSHGSLAVRAVRRRCATERAYPCNVPQGMRTHAVCHRACIPMQCATEHAYPCNVPQSVHTHAMCHTVRTHAMCHRVCVPMHCCATEHAYPCNVPQSVRTHAMCHRACVPMPMQCATERAYPVLRGEVELRQSLLVLGPRCSVIGPGSSASVLGPGPWALGPGWVPSLQGGLSCLTVLRAACPASQC